MNKMMKHEYTQPFFIGIAVAFCLEDSHLVGNRMGYNRYNIYPTLTNHYGRYNWEQLDITG
jgi:hypothetical protein